MVYLSLQRYFQKYSIDISPEISKIRHGILLGLLQALGDVALGIVALAGVPPFGELNDDDFHERNREEDDPSGAMPMNIDEGHPKEPGDRTNRIQRAQHGSDAARCDCRAHNVIGRNEEQQKQRRPPNAAEHPEGEVAHNHQGPEGELQPLLSPVRIEITG